MTGAGQVLPFWIDRYRATKSIPPAGVAGGLTHG